MTYTIESLARHKKVMRRAVWPPVTAVCILAIVLGTQIYLLLRAIRLADHTDQVISQAQYTQKLMVDMETGQRGYLVGNDPTFLQPYHEAAEVIDKAFDALTQLTHLVPEQVHRIAGMRRTFAEWTHEANIEMAFRQRAGSSYITYFNLGKGKALMDRERSELDDFLKAETSLRDERTRAAQNSTYLTLMVGAMSAIIIGSVVMFTTKRALNELAEQYETSLDAEQQAREYFTTTLTSIGDAVLVTDAEGKVTLLNPIAEELTKWTKEEAAGQDSKKVFDIVNEATRMVVESPVERVMREGIIVGLANHTMLLRRDGSEIHIDDSGAPIFDKDGTLTGVVLVFRDVSERKKEEHAREAIAEKASRIAETLQQSLLLTPPPNAFKGVTLATLYESAWDEAEIGGDFFDAFALDEKTVAFVVGDVTGKGLRAASFTAEVKFTLRALLREHRHPTAALIRLNQFLLDSERLGEREDNAMIALSVVTFQTESGTLIVAAGGAEPPIVLRHGDRQAAAVDVRGALLGMDTDSDYESVEVTLAEGDLFMMMTDGITESRRGRDFYGPEGVIETAQRIPSEKIDVVARAIVDDAKKHCGGTLRDDVCLIVVERTATPTIIEL